MNASAACHHMLFKDNFIGQMFDTTGTVSEIGDGKHRELALFVFVVSFIYILVEPCTDDIQNT